MCTWLKIKLKNCLGPVNPHPSLPVYRVLSDSLLYRVIFGMLQECGLDKRNRKLGFECSFICSWPVGMFRPINTGTNINWVQRKLSRQTNHGFESLLFRECFCKSSISTIWGFWKYKLGENLIYPGWPSGAFNHRCPILKVSDRVVPFVVYSSLGLLQELQFDILETSCRKLTRPRGGVG